MLVKIEGTYEFTVQKLAKKNIYIFSIPDLHDLQDVVMLALKSGGCTMRTLLSKNEWILLTGDYKHYCCGTSFAEMKYTQIYMYCIHVANYHQQI